MICVESSSSFEVLVRQNERYCHLVVKIRNYNRCFNHYSLVCALSMMLIFATYFMYASFIGPFIFYFTQPHLLLPSLEFHTTLTLVFIAQLMIKDSNGWVKFEDRSQIEHIHWCVNSLLTNIFLKIYIAHSETERH